jgi:hypothetical protein
MQHHLRLCASSRRIAKDMLEALHGTELAQTCILADTGSLWQSYAADWPQILAVRNKFTEERSALWLRCMSDHSPYIVPLSTLSTIVVPSPRSRNLMQLPSVEVKASSLDQHNSIRWSWELVF